MYHICTETDHVDDEAQFENAEMICIRRCVCVCVCVRFVCVYAAPGKKFTQLRTESTVRDDKAASCCKLPWQETRKDEHLCSAACGAEHLSLLPAVLLKKAAAVCHATSVWAESPAQLKLSTSP